MGIWSWIGNNFHIGPLPGGCDFLFPHGCKWLGSSSGFLNSLNYFCWQRSSVEMDEIAARTVKERCESGLKRSKSDENGRCGALSAPEQVDCSVERRLLERRFLTFESRGGSVGCGYASAGRPTDSWRNVTFRNRRVGLMVQQQRRRHKDGGA